MMLELVSLYNYATRLSGTWFAVIPVIHYLRCVSDAGAVMSCQPGASEHLWSSMGVWCVLAIVRLLPHHS